MGCGASAPEPGDTGQPSDTGQPGDMGDTGEPEADTNKATPADSSKSGSTEDLTGSDHQSEADPTGPWNFLEFPTPAKLDSAQRQFAETAKSVFLENDSSEMPSPQPPATDRKDLFSAEDLYALDMKVVDTPEYLLRVPLKQLVSFLSALAQDDVGRVRLFYTWIGSQDIKLCDWHEEIPHGCALHYLALHYSGLGSLNDLFCQFCRLSDIHCKLITGSIKLTPPNQCCVVIKGNCWCAVYVRKSWRLVDLDAASIGIRKSKDAHEKYVERMSKSLHLSDPQSLASNGIWFGKYRKRGKDKSKMELDVLYEEQNHHEKKTGMNEYFFLTNPQEFIYDHFPDDEQWQLLARRVTADEFKNMAAIKRGFFKLYHDTNQPKCILKASDGNVSIQLEMKSAKTARIAYNLRKVEGGVSIPCKKGSWNDYCYAEGQGIRKLVKVSLIETGLYQLDLYSFDISMQTGSGEEPLLLAKYMIECGQPFFKCVPNPSNPRYEYGPGDEMLELGIEAVSHPGGTVMASDGSAVVRFRCNVCAFQFTHVLESRCAKREHLTAMSRHYYDNQTGEVSFLLKLPSDGKYLFKIYCRVHDTADPFYNICNYLIVSDMGCADSRPYPPARYGQIGQLLDTNNSPVVAESHHCPVVWPTPDQPLTLKLDMTSADRFLDIQFSRHDHLEATPNNMSDFVWQRVERNEKLYVDVRFPRPGIYSLTLHGTEVVRNELTVKDFCIYVFIVDHPSSPYMAFPIAHSSWAPTFTLCEPQGRYLPSNTAIKFKFKIPGAEVVGVLTHTWSTMPLKRQHASHAHPVDENSITLSNTSETDAVTVKGSVTSDKDDDDITDTADYWVGEVETGPGGSSVTLVTRFSGMHEFFYLLEYQVVSDSDSLNMAQTHHQVQEEAELLLEARQRLKQKQIEQVSSRREEDEHERVVWQRTHDEKKPQIESELASYWLEHETSKQKFIEQEESRLAQSCRRLTDEEEGIIVKETARRMKLETLRKDEGFYRKKFEGFKHSSVRESMRKATRIKDKESLMLSIQLFQKQQLLEKDGDLTLAMKSLEIQEARAKLDAAKDDLNVEKIKAALAHIDSQGLNNAMQKDVQSAESLIDQLSRTNDLKTSLLKMDRLTLSEVRSYVRPPEAVHDVIVATLLCLGDDEYVTNEWATCQKLCASLGVDGLGRRIIDLHIPDLHPEIVSRVRQIIKPHKLHQVQQVSAGAAAFLIWLLGTLDAWDKSNGDQAALRVLPASISRQREIFGRPPLRPEWYRPLEKPAIKY